MIRRFEIYDIAPDAAEKRVRALETVCRECGRYIPEVLHSSVGWNVAGERCDLVWEHGFASPAAYRRYMVHPYHAGVLDRYLLHDSPERVVRDNELGAGLVGYGCDGPVFAMAGGVRRLVLLRLRRDAPVSEVRRLACALGDVPAEVDGFVVSVVAQNTLGPAWFDAETPIGGPPRWTHLWEQGFVDDERLESYLDGPSSVAAAERREWRDSYGGIVERSVSFRYLIGGPRPEPG